MLWIYQHVCLFSGNISQASGFRGSLAWQVLGRGGACNGACPPPRDREPQDQQGCRNQKEGRPRQRAKDTDMGAVYVAPVRSRGPATGSGSRSNPRAQKQNSLWVL